MRAGGLAAEERRRKFTILLLAGGLLATTIPVNNLRAIFSPQFTSVAEPGVFAYAADFDGLGGHRTGGGSPSRRRRVAPADELPPLAFAARVPGEVVPPAQTPPERSAQEPGPPPDDPSGPPPSSPAPPVPTPPIEPPPIPGPTPNPPPDPTDAVPEPATWLMMILGFGVIGWVVRRARRDEDDRIVSVASA